MPRVLSEGKERPKPGFQVLDTTPYSHSANLAPPGPGHPRTYLTYRRAAEGAGLHALGITDLCLILPSKGEGTPHTYYRLPRNLNLGMVSGALGQELRPAPPPGEGVDPGHKGHPRTKASNGRGGPRGATLVLGNRTRGSSKDKDCLGVVEKMDPRNLCQPCVCLSLAVSGAVGPRSVPVLQGGLGQGQHAGV